MIIHSNTQGVTGVTDDGESANALSMKVEIICDKILDDIVLAHSWFFLVKHTEIGVVVYVQSSSDGNGACFLIYREIKNRTVSIIFTLPKYDIYGC